MVYCEVQGEWCIVRYRESGVLVKREIVDIQRRQRYLCT